MLALESRDANSGPDANVGVPQPGSNTHAIAKVNPLIGFLAIEG
jgi:hypothetical protein